MNTKITVTLKNPGGPSGIYWNTTYQTSFSNTDSWKVNLDGSLQIRQGNDVVAQVATGEWITVCKDVTDDC